MLVIDFLKALNVWQTVNDKKGFCAFYYNVTVERLILEATSVYLKIGVIIVYRLVVWKVVPGFMIYVLYCVV